MASVSARDQYLTEVVLALRDQLSREGQRAGATLDRLDSSTTRLTANWNQAATASQKFSFNLKELGLQALALNEIKGLILSLVAPIQQVGELSDTWKELTARVGIFAGEGANVAQIMARIGQIAQESRTPLKDVGTLYARLAQGLSEQNVSQAQLLTVVQGLSDALLLAGATAAEAGGAVWQFSQAMASGTLRGEEFNSVAEQAPLILDALAKELKVAKGDLRAMAAEGKLTSEILIRAISGMSEEWRAQADSIPLTINRAFTNLTSAMTEYLGTSESAVAATDAFAGAIQAMADNLDTIGGAFNTAGMLALIAAMTKGVAVTGAFVASQAAATVEVNKRIAATGLYESAQAKAARAESARVANLRQQAQGLRNAALWEEVRADKALDSARNVSAAAEVDHVRARAAVEVAQAEQRAARSALKRTEADLVGLRSAQAAAQANVEAARATFDAAATIRSAQAASLGLAEANDRLALATERVARAEAILSREQAFLNASTRNTAIQQGLLASARERQSRVLTELDDKERGYSKSVSDRLIANRKLIVETKNTSNAFKELATFGGALEATMAAFIGYEIGAWLRDIAKETKAGAAAFATFDSWLGKIKESYAGLVEAEQQKAFLDEKQAEILKRVNRETGLNLKTFEELKDARESGLVIWSEERDQWEKGLVVQKALVQGLGDLDSAYARTLDTLDKHQKATEKVTKSTIANLGALKDVAEVYEDERRALVLTTQAKQAAAVLAERDVGLARSALAVAQKRVESLKRENERYTVLSAAQAKHLNDLENEVVERRAAVEAAEAQAAASRAQVVAAQAAADTYGDQSEELGALQSQQKALTDEILRMQEAMVAGASSQAALADAQEVARAAAERYHAAMTGVTNEALEPLVAEFQRANAVVEEHQAKIEAGAAAEQALEARQAALALATKKVADAARDAAAATDIQIQAEQRALALSEQRLGLARDKIEIERESFALAQAYWEAEAEAALDEQKRIALQREAREEEIKGRERVVRAMQNERDLLMASADAKAREAELMREKADQLEILAKNTGDYTTEEKAQVQQTRDAADALDLEAERLRQAQYAKTDAIAATRRLNEQYARLAEQALVLAEEFAKAGEAGVNSVRDVQRAIDSAADSDGLARLARALEEAWARGVFSAEEYRALLEQIDRKQDELREKAERKFDTDYEALFRQFGTDVDAVRRANTNRRNPGYGADVAKDYEQWLREQGAFGDYEAAPSTAAEVFARRREQAQAAQEAQPARGQVVTVRFERGGQRFPLYGAKGDAEGVVKLLREEADVALGG